MKQYIDRNILKRLIKWVPTLRYECCDYWDVESVINVIDTIPHEDVLPVVHAHWIPSWRYEECSNCGYDARWGTDYCPNCGAKMDEEVSE